jgi:beta-lactam-binding protein with PASTA domain
MVLDQSVVEVQPGATASFRVTVRNTGALVEGCSVSVRGIPSAWQRMDPDHFNLDVDEQRDVQVHITPPRGPKTTAGRTAMAIVVRSEVSDEIQQRADATLVIEPYFELATTLEPVEIEGKRGGYTYVNVENRGNKTERVAFVGSEPGKRLRFSFRPAELEVRAGQRGSVGVDVRARRRVWGGGEKPRQFSIAVTGAEGPPPPPMQGRFGQLPSWPRWVIPAVAAVLAIAIPTTLLLVNRSLDKSAATALISVPKLTDLTADAAKQALTQKQLVPNARNVYRSGNPGVVVDQDPPPGQKVDKGTPVKIDVSTDHVVPNVKDKPVEIAKAAVAREGMTVALGGDQDGPDDKQGFVAWQDPEPGQPAPDGVVTIGVYRTAELKLLNYQDLDEISVSNQLTNSGLKVDPRPEGSDKPKGTIVQQYPPPGTVVKKGDTVTLIVSSGHPPDASTTVFDPTASSADVTPST